MKIKAVVFLVIVLFFSYQNCSQKNLSGPIGEKTQNSPVESQSLSDLQVQQVKFYTEQSSEMQKGSHKFFIYDVWGHQEDDQRKAILVELTEFISCEKRNIGRRIRRKLIINFMDLISPKIDFF